MYTVRTMRCSVQRSRPPPPPLQVPRKQAAQRLFAGGLAGALSRSMVAPLERVRTILMASPAPLTMRAAAGAAWRDGGAAGLFKGNMASVVKVLPASAVQFAVYDGISDAIKGLRGVGANGRARIVDRLAAGVAAGAASCVATYPLDTVRTMMSVPGISQGGFLRVRDCPPCAARVMREQRAARGLRVRLCGSARRQRRRRCNSAACAASTRASSRRC